MKEINITKGFVAKVDDCDYEFLSYFSWYAVKPGQGRKFYAGCTTKKAKNRKHFLMHRLILNAKKGESVDHINGDTLDNRRSNLRLCTCLENSRAFKLKKNNATSKYRGVYLHSGGKKWIAQIVQNKKPVYLGCFFSEEEAAKKYDEFAIKHYGAFATPNY